MMPIPMELRKEISADPWYQECCLSGPHGEGFLSGRITWAHVYKYAGKRIQEKWNIIPVCALEHLTEEHLRGNIQKRDEMCRIALSRASEEDLAKYPKKDWAQEKQRLGI